ncbi:MAG: D-cysteine desulfhydrase family protein [Armatimonadota bacterium]|nr:D-cysteine desulfhydrase family protein [Armatimonadota bacterium]MDR7533577.1 D-cysteine desulfhydrase family protein [Armatimonadota bacterium]MDR7537377.1 D-cysteine desulfhydrase family protein [Armatimonadota bacterium]
MQLGRLPRLRLATLPTPLEEMPTLSAYLGGPRLLVKRDDMTGLAFGGNKVRKLEYLLGDAVDRGCDVVVTVGAAQSNHARATAAAARRLGLDVVLVLAGDEPLERQGNLLLDVLFGADIRIVDTDDNYVLMGVVEDIARDLQRRGRVPYVMPPGGSAALGAAAYANAGLELLDQLNTRGVHADAIVHATGTGGTQAGLYAAFRLMQARMEIIGVSAGPSRDVVTARVRSLVEELCGLLGIDWRPHPDDIVVTDEYVGERYAVATPEGLDAIRLVARTEGLLLDPVYTGKAMAGLIDLVRRGRFRSDQSVVFWHTGGQPALFAYAAALGEG